MSKKLAEEYKEFLPIATSMTSAEGLDFAVGLPGRPEVDAFVVEEARRAGVGVGEMRRQVLERGFAQYLLDELRLGHLTQTQTANLLGVHYTDFYRMAYGTGALKPPARVAALLAGDPGAHVRELRGLSDVVVEEISYGSSMEDLSPLYAEVIYQPEHKHAPVLVLQHGGYPSSRVSMLSESVAFARQGFFCVAVSKRGRDGSVNQGVVDGSGAVGEGFCRETLDIVDAVQFCRREFAEFVHPDSASVYGTSAGGIDVLACVVHFPDFFRCAVAMYGPHPDVRGLVDILRSDVEIYELAGPSSPPAIVESGRIERERCAADITRDVGGTAEEYPDRWLARDLSRYGVNNPYTRTFFLWDEEDGFAGKPGFKVALQRYLDEQRARGYVNTEVIESHIGDPQRFLHWSESDQRLFYHRFIPALLADAIPQPTLSHFGHLKIPGFVRTKPFTVWLGRGDDAVASLEYELQGTGGIFRFRRLSADPSTRGRLILHRPTGDKEIDFDLDDTIHITD